MSKEGIAETLPAGTVAGAADRNARAWLPIAAGLVAVTLWASAFVGIRFASRELSAGALTLARLSVGSLLLGILIVSRGERMPPRATRPGIAACGVLWFGVYNIALNEAERRVDAGTAAMLVNVGPILIALLGGFFLHEGFPRTLFVGSTIAFAGTVIIGASTSTTGMSAGIGVLLCLVAAAGYASAVVIQKPLLRDASALQVTWLACTVGAIVCLPFLPSLVQELRLASPSTIAWTLYLGVMPTSVAFTAWAYALAHTTAGKMGSMTYLAPPLAIIMAWLILSEAPPLLALPGGALCLLGVVIARRGPIRSRSPVRPGSDESTERARR
ncbi:MAG: DMT family transporter [Actinomycetota bacterium]